VDRLSFVESTDGGRKDERFEAAFENERSTGKPEFIEEPFADTTDYIICLILKTTAIQTTPPWPPALMVSAAKMRHPGHRLRRKTFQSMPVPLVILIGSGSRRS
jgi:hypothetical protein